MSQPRLIGELAVVALEAENLPKIPGEFRPFCVFKVGNNAKRTNAATDGGRNPNWDAQVNMPVPHGFNQMIVEVLHEDPRGNQIICEGIVDLSKVLKEGECDGWYPLKQQGKEAGDIYLELTFYSVVANAPPTRQPTRVAHPRPPHMGGYQRPPPMPNQFAGRPRPPPMQQPSPAPLHMSPAPHPQAPLPPLRGSFSGGPPPPPGPYGGGTLPPPPPPPVGFHVGPPGPHLGPSPHGSGPMGMPSHSAPPPSMMSPGPAPPSVSLGNQWRTSGAQVNQPSYGQQGPYPPRPQQPMPPQNAPLLSSPYRPGPPPPRPYNNGGGFPPGNQPGKPLPNYPPEHYHPNSYGGPPPQQQQQQQQHMYPVQGGPPGGGYPSQGRPQGYPSQPGYPPY